jgi:acetyltransferase-like isoleucine patch superfamily enzyme
MELLPKMSIKPTNAYDLFKKLPDIFHVVKGFIFGYLIKIAYKLINPNVKIGRKFYAYTWPTIIGPGKVTLGDSVVVYKNYDRRPFLVTHSKEAHIEIGNNTRVSGVRISCIQKISIGSFCGLGNSTIMDTDFIPSPKKLNISNEEFLKSAPIKIGDYFWLATNGIVMKGCQFGDGCVLGSGSIARNLTADDKSLIIGNPGYVHKKEK